MLQRRHAGSLGQLWRAQASVERGGLSTRHHHAHSPDKIASAVETTQLTRDIARAFA